MIDGVLSGVTVLDLTRVLSGPYCTMMLGDMGARVLKVEHPRGGDDTRAWGPPFVSGESTYFLSVNRNKESLTLDFKKPAGRRVLDALLARADVLVENFRPGTLERQGLDYGTLASRFPRLVYCSISGYGHSGPRRETVGYDAIVQAESGVMSLTGMADGPGVRFGLPIADLTAALFATQGILLALMARATTGRGQHIDLSMFDTMVALLTYHATTCLGTGVPPGRMGNAHPSIVPYGTFAASDGDVMLAVGNDQQWQRFCAVADLPDLAADERFLTNPQRVAHRDVLEPRLARVFAQHTRADWIDRCHRASVPCGAVRDVGESLADPQLAARGMIGCVVHPSTGPLRMLANPLMLSEHAPRRAMPPPRLGEHTEDVLVRDLGFTSAEVRELRHEEVI